MDLDKLQETVVQLTSERDAIQQENSKVKFELADAKKKIDTTSEKVSKNSNTHTHIYIYKHAHSYVNEQKEKQIILSEYQVIL